jgi:hypothetical protein
MSEHGESNNRTGRASGSEGAVAEDADLGRDCGAVYSGLWGGWYYRNHRYDGFAKCLASKQAKMYGLYWCPHCAEQKEMFGKPFGTCLTWSARSKASTGSRRNARRRE